MQQDKLHRGGEIRWGRPDVVGRPDKQTVMLCQTVHTTEYARHYFLYGADTNSSP